MNVASCFDNFTSKTGKTLIEIEKKKKNRNFELSNRVALEKPILISGHQEPIGATFNQEIENMYCVSIEL